MASQWGDNFEITAALPDFTRQQYNTFADMKAVSKLSMPPMYIAYCLEDRKVYLYNKQNSVDPVTGLWRVFGEGGGSSGEDKFRFSTMPTATSSLAGKIYQYIGETDTYTKGYFYECRETDNDVWEWVQLDTQPAGGSGESIQKEVLPTASAAELNKIYQYVGDTTSSYIKGYFYRCITEGDPATYAWVQTNVQPSSGGGASAAEDVSYANLEHPTATNVKLALDEIYDKVFYVDPKVNSFNMTPATAEYEIGSSVSDLAFTWSYNKEMVSQSLTDCTLADATVRSATAAGPYTSNKTFTLTANDGQKSVTSNKTISFKHKVYYGSAAEPSTFDSAFILALSGKKFATTTKGTYSMNVASGEYGFLAYPSSWGDVNSWWIGGFEVTTHDCGTISFTNASGNTTTFRIVRTTQAGLGNISAEVK